MPTTPPPTPLIAPEEALEGAELVAEKTDLKRCASIEAPIWDPSTQLRVLRRRPRRRHLLGR